MRTTPQDIRQNIAAQPWGDAFLREFDLVLAAGLLESMRTRSTLYNIDIERRVAAFCLPLDGAVDEAFLGNFDVPENPQNPHFREQFIYDMLHGRPAGHWAIYKMDGKVEAYGSDGRGGHVSTHGNPFMYSTVVPGEMNFFEMYAATLGTPIYYRRSEIEAEILAASYQATPPAVGTVVTDQYLSNKRWAKVEVVETHGDYVVAKATRRGVRATHFKIPASSAVRLFDVPLVMPTAFEDPGNELRLLSSYERRAMEADAHWKEEMRDGLPSGVSVRGSGQRWIDEGDTLVRPLLALDETSPAGDYRIEFDEGNRIVSAGFVPTHRPTLSL